MKGKTKGYNMSALPQNTGGGSPQSRNYDPHTLDVLTALMKPPLAQRRKQAETQCPDCP